MRQPVLYLASGSPRRRALIASLGLPVVTGTTPLDEDAATAAYTGDPALLAEHLARAKAEAALRERASALPTGAVIVAADTTVLLDGQSLGKPGDADDARRMLARLRDRTHQVVTSVAVASIAAGPCQAAGQENAVSSLRVTTQVTMRAYTDAEVAAYIASGDPLDKAGAYAIQHAEFHPVESISGCYLSVVGLPLCALSSLIASLPEAPPVGTDSAATRPPRATVTHCPWSAECREPFPGLPGAASPGTSRQAGHAR